MIITFRQVARFVWSYFRRRPVILAVVIIFLAVQAALELAMPYFVGELTDHVAQTFNSSPVAFWGAMRWLTYIMAAGIFFHIFNIGTHFIYDIFIKFPARRDAAVDTFARVQRFSTDWHANSFAGATVTKIKRGMNAIEQFADKFYDNFIPLGFLMLGMLWMILSRWEMMGVIFAVGIVVYSASSIWMASRFVSPIAREAALRDTLLGGACADSISCNATVKMFGREKAEDRHFWRVTQNWMLKLLSRYNTGNVVNLVQNMLMTVLKFSLLFFVLWLWANGQASVGDVTFIIAIYNLLSGHLRTIGQQIRELQQSVNDMEEMVEYSLTPEQVSDRSDAKDLIVKKGLIEFKKVTFTYSNQRKPIYKDFSFTIQPGEKVALVGHSGGGKTTFVKLLQRLYDVDSGAIRIDGQDISKVTQKSLRRTVALVPQDPILFHRSIAENIAYSRPKASGKEIEKVARQAHAHEFINQLPQKYETLVGERGVKLSGGERQRVAVARAILADAPILVLDEATSSLDSISESYIQEALEYLMRGRTTIVVAHRLSTIKKADRILVFDGGKVIEEGSHEKLVRLKGGLYRELYEMQAGGFIGE